MINNQTPYDGEEDLDLPRRQAFPDSVMLLGETVDHRYLPLQVDGDDRLVMAVASQVWIPRTVQLIGTSAAVLESTAGYLVEVDVVNVTAGAVQLALYYSAGPSPAATEIIFNGNCPARTNTQLLVTLEIGTKDLYAMAGAANSLYALCTLHRGREYIRT